MTNEKKETTASEIIIDLQKQLILDNDRMERLYEDVSRIQSMFKAIHYSVSEGGISQPDCDNCFCAMQNMINVLADNVSDTYGMSSAFLKEVL